MKLERFLYFSAFLMLSIIDYMSYGTLWPTFIVGAAIIRSMDGI